MKLFGIVVYIVMYMVFTAAIMSLPVMLLWDWLMPKIFGLPEITWFQAWGLLFLSGMLFKTHQKKGS